MSRYHNARAFAEGSMPAQATLPPLTLDLPISSIHIPGQPPRRVKHSKLNWPLLPQEDWREPQVAYFKLIWEIHLFTHVGPDGEMNFHGDGKVISHRRTELIARWYYLSLPIMQQPREAMSFSALTIWYSVATAEATSELLRYEFETMKKQSDLWKPQVARIVRGCCTWHATGPSLTLMPLTGPVICGDDSNFSHLDVQHFSLVYAMFLYFRAPELERIHFSIIDGTLRALWIHMNPDHLPSQALKTPARYIWESLQMDECGTFLRGIPTVVHRYNRINTGSWAEAARRAFFYHCPKPIVPSDQVRGLQGPAEICADPAEGLPGPATSFVPWPKLVNGLRPGEIAGPDYGKKIYGIK